MKYKLLVSAFFTVLLLASAAHADLIINGGFEDPALRYGTWNAGYTSISGWTATFGTIEIQNHAAGNPYEGNQLCELDSYYNSGMKQDVATVAGQTYDLNFAYSPRPNNVATSNYIEIYFDGALLASQRVLRGLSIANSAAGAQPLRPPYPTSVLVAPSNCPHFVAETLQGPQRRFTAIRL